MTVLTRCVIKGLHCTFAHFLHLRPRSEVRHCQAGSGSELFDTLMVFLNDSLTKLALCMLYIHWNKRALGPWFAHLRMTVHMGIGKHSSSQSPAMNFDRSAISLRLKINMGYVDKINRM